MHKRFLLPIASILLFGAVIISGCKKVVHQNIQAASNTSVSLVVFNDVFEQLIIATNNGTSLDQISQSTWNLSGSVCATVTLSPLGSSFPKTLTVNYGNSCTGFNGIARKGSFSAEISGNLADEGTTIDIQFNGFSRGQYIPAGDYSITVGGMDGSGNPLFSETISGGSISWGAQQMLWRANLMRKWTEGSETGFNTPDTSGTMGVAGLNDDVFEITGAGSGNNLCPCSPKRMPVCKARNFGRCACQFQYRNGRLRKWRMRQTGND